MEGKWLQYNLGHLLHVRDGGMVGMQRKKSPVSQVQQKHGNEDTSPATKLRHLHLPILEGMHRSYDLGLEARALLT